MTAKTSVSLTDEQYAFVRTLVEAGRYSSVSAVLQQGIDLLRGRMDAEELEREALREVLARRRSGGFVSGARMDGRIADMIAAKRETAPLRHLGLPDDLFDREDAEQAAIDAGDHGDALGIWRGPPAAS